MTLRPAAPLFCLLVLSLCGCLLAHAQSRPDPSLLRPTDTPRAWLTFALGAGHGLGDGLNSSVGASVSASIPSTRLVGQLGLNLNTATDLNTSLNTDVADPYGVSMHLGLGPSKRWDQAALAFLAGPAYAWGRRLGTGRAYQSAGLHTSAQFFFVPISGFGFGLDVFHAWSAAERTSGFRLAVQVGKM